MPESRLTPSLLLRGARVSGRHAAASLRALDRDRRLALGLGLGLLVVLGAPWYEVRMSAPGIDGARRTLTQGMSGWSALSLAAIVCALVAIGTVGLLLVRPGSAVEGLGAHGRRAVRERTDGCLLAAGGGLLVLAFVWSLLGHAAPHLEVAGATGSRGVRWGLVVALLLAAALTAAGVRIARAARDASDARAGDPRSSPGAERTARGKSTAETGAPTELWAPADAFADPELWSDPAPRPRAGRPGAPRPSPTRSEPGRSREARTYIQGRRP